MHYATGNVAAGDEKCCLGEKMSLENAPDDVKLAVDLIQLLEEHQLPVETVLSALAIVQRDYEKKRNAASPA